MESSSPFGMTLYGAGRWNLWVARPGTIEKYTLDDLPERRPSFTLDLELLERPARTG